MDCWTQGDQKLEDSKKHPLQLYINNVIASFQAVNTGEDFDEHGNYRHLAAEQDSSNPNAYTLSSFWVESKVTFNESAKTLRIEWYNIDFPIEEWIKWANFIHKMKRERGGTCGMKPPEPFTYNEYIGINWPGLYFQKDNLILLNASTYTDNVLKKETMKSKYPTVVKNIETILPILNKIKDNNNMPYWKAK